MKKIFALMLALVMLLCLCSCGNKYNQKVRNSFDKAVAYTESLLDTSSMTSFVRDESNGNYIYKYWNHGENEGNADIDLNVEIEGHTITLNKTTVRDLKDMGFEVMIGFETLAPGETASLAIYSKDKRIAFNTARNETNEKVDVNDMPLCAFYGEMDDGHIPFVYRGLTIGSTLEEIVAALGSPNNAASIATDETGSSIGMDYFSDSTEDNAHITSALSITANYDADADTAVLSNVQLDIDIEPLEKTE